MPLIFRLDGFHLYPKNEAKSKVEHNCLTVATRIARTFVSNRENGNLV